MTEQIVNFERMEYALTLFGNSDENIRMLEQGYGVSVVFRGTDIKVSGDAEKVMTCTRCIEGLLKMVESGEELSAQNIRYMMSLVEEGREQEAEALRTAAGQMSAKMRAVRIVSAARVSRRDLEARLVRKGEDPQQAKEAVAWMEDLHLVDDRATAEQVVSSCISKGYGLMRAKQALYE